MKRTLIGVSAILLTTFAYAATRTPSKTVWMNEDNGHFYDTDGHPDSDMTVEGCRRLVDNYARSGTITGILFCVNIQRALYDSDVWERVRDISPDIRYSQHLKLLSDRGVDHFKVWLERCREVGIAGWLTMRMNDSHGLEEFNWDLPCPGSFKLWPSQKWRKHPEWRRAPYRHERSWEGSYNYLVPEVYEHHLALVREILSKWDMEGLELDWLRWGMHFPPGGELEGRKVLTRFVKEVRALADAAEKRVGHRIRLGHRVPVDPDIALRYGYDVAAWAEAGCVDMLTLSGFMAQTPDDIPVELWRRLLRPGTVVNASCSPGRSSCLYNQVYDDVILRGNAASAWACGVDGLYLFNQCYREPAHLAELEDYLLDICSQENNLRCTRRIAAGAPEPLPGYALRHLFPYPLAPRFIGCSMARMDRNVTIRLTTGPVLPDSVCTLTLCFDKDADADRLKDLPVRVNTRLCTFVRRIDLDLNRVDQSKPHVRSGEWPRDAKTVLEFAVPPDALHARENAIELLPPENAKGNVIWADVRVTAGAK